MGDAGAVYPGFTPRPTPPANSSEYPIPIPTVDGPQCNRIRIDYNIVTAVICAMCFIFGILYTFFGYRFFKATMFLTGFIFGAVITYLICLEENLLPIEGKVGVALAAGVLCGLITMLVQYVGLFMTGLQFGLLAGIGALVIMEQFYHPSSTWIPIGVLFGGGLLFALSTLYFQKGLTILGTAIFGAALMVTALDYYVEMFLMVDYVWDRVKAEPVTEVCWFSWVILGLWPLAFLIGTAVQWRVTGKGFDHHEVRRPPETIIVHTAPMTPPQVPPTAIKIPGPGQAGGSATLGPDDTLYIEPSVTDTLIHNRKQKKVDLQRLRMKQRRDAQHSRYRHLYQIRRSNGDVISQSYIHHIQGGLSPAMRNLAQVTDSEERPNVTRLH